MPRIPELRPDQMSSPQQRIHDEILAGPRGSLQGPFHAWLYSPGLADPAQKLGEFGRHGVVDLVGIVGYYCLVSITLNVFDMPLPKGESPPLSP